MITKPGCGKNILEQQSFANETKKEIIFTGSSRISCSSYISGPKK